MNQILNTQPPEERNKGKQKNKQKSTSLDKKQSVSNSNAMPNEIKNIIKSFAIFLIVFSIFAISFASYTLFKGYKEKEDLAKKPEIEIVYEDNSSSELDLIVTSNSAIEKVEYYWDGDKKGVLYGNGRLNINEKISNVPDGTHELKVVVTNSAGVSNEQIQEISRDSNIKISLEDSSPNLKISVESKEDLKLITYRWNKEEENEEEVEGKEASFEIDVPKGKNTLTVIAVDKDNNTEKVVQEVSGQSSEDREDDGLGPDVSIEITDTDFLLSATSEKGVRRVELYVTNSQKDGEQKFKDEREVVENWEFAFPLYKGENKIKIIAFDTDNNVTIKEASKTIAD